MYVSNTHIPPPQKKDWLDKLWFFHTVWFFEANKNGIEDSK